MPDYLETTVDKFIFRVATDRLYSPQGVWVSPEPDRPGRVRLGLSDYVQQRNGDVAFVHLKPPGTRVSRGDEFGDLETIKATMSLDSPVAGEIVEINQQLDARPEQLNQEPYGKGWLAVIDAADWQADRRGLLDPQAYFAAMRKEAEEEQQSL